MRCKVISSGKISDRKAKSIVDKDGHCDEKCPFFRLDNNVEFVATCFRDAKVIEYLGGYLAHCTLQNA